MALLLLDGFEWYSAEADLAYRWSSYPSGASTKSTTIKRGGTDGGGASLGIYRGSYIAQNFQADKNSIVFGFGFYTTGLSIYTSSGLVWIQNASAAGQTALMLTASGTLSVWRDQGQYGTKLAETASQVIFTSTWHYIEALCTVHDSAGVWRVWVDGAKVIDITGQDTRHQTTGYIRILRFQATCDAGYNYFDDLYLIDPDMAGFTDRLDQPFVHCLKPNGAGNYSQWTPSAGNNYECVDDIGPDEDTTYVETDVDGEKDSYNFEDCGSWGAIIAAQMQVVGKRSSGSGSHSVTPFARIGSTDYMGSEKGLSDGYIGIRAVWENNPADSQPWETTDLDSAQFGVLYQVTTTTSA